MARRTASPLVLVLVVFGATALPARAQEAGTPAHIAFVDGSAVLEREGRVESDLTSMPLLAGDRIRTQGGRVEVLFADGSALHLDATTVVDFQSDQVIRLLEGQIRLAIAGPAKDVSYRIDAPSAWVQINDPGEYRIAILRNADVELAVLRGAAELVNEQGRSFIRAGERTFARQGEAPSPAYVYNSAAWDAFDRWSEERRDRRLGASAQYLPPDVRPYAGTFDAYGDWRYEQAYGYVWYPRVHVGWRPYYHGRWLSLRPYGWTWIGADPWGWPTHHYGRWGISAGLWYWIPGRHWGPAWVSWAYASDYVSWCPLGWNNRPVLQIVNINVFGGRRYSPWDAWTVVPRRHFSAGFVNVRSITNVRVERHIHNTFVIRDGGPETRHAVGRAGPIRTAGRYAVPRGSVPGAYASEAMPLSSGDRRIDGRADGRAAAPSRSPGAPAVTSSAGEREASPSTRVAGDRAVRRERSAPASDAPAVRSTGSSGSDVREYRRTPVPRQPSTGSDSSATASPGAVRAAPRERSAQDSTTPVFRGNAPSGSDTRDVRRTPETRRPSGDVNAPVTSAPSGAVRAAPRVRERSDSMPVDPSAASPGRARTRDDRAPAYSTPPTPRNRSRLEAAPVNPGSPPERPRVREYRAPAYSAPPADSPPARPAPPPVEVYRGTPSRSSPQGNEGYGGRAAPPRTPEPAAPSFRSIPEQRRGPSGPPPSAAPQQDRRSSGDSGRAGGDSRQRSGGAQSSGQGARRRR